MVAPVTGSSHHRPDNFGRLAGLRCDGTRYLSCMALIFYLISHSSGRHVPAKTCCINTRQILFWQVFIAGGIFAASSCHMCMSTSCSADVHVNRMLCSRLQNGGLCICSSGGSDAFVSGGSTAATPTKLTRLGPPQHSSMWSETAGTAGDWSIH